MPRLFYRGNIIMYKRKTTDEYTLQANYGYGFEDITTEETRIEINKRLKEYRENDQRSYKIVKRRVKI